MDYNQRRDQLESVRPHSNDLARDDFQDSAAELRQDPQLAQEFERQLGSDAKIAGAMQRVNPPSDLAERVLARLSEARTAGAESTSDDSWPAPIAAASEFVAAEQEQEAAAQKSQLSIQDTDYQAAGTPGAAPRGTGANVSPARLTAPLGRVRMRLTAGLLALAATVLLVVVARPFFGTAGYQLSTEDFKQQTLAWKNAVEEESWTTENATAILEQFPLNSMLRTPSGYQQLDARLSDTQSLVAYNFSNARQRAYLFVAHTELRSEGVLLDGIPPAESSPLSAGWRTAAWREGPLLYVLLHTGGAQGYGQLVRTPGDIARRTESPTFLVAKLYHAR